MSEARIRIMCVDDHAVVREGIAHLIELHPDLELVASADSGEQAVQLFAECRPDVTLMDLQLPRMSGLDAICEIRRQWPDCRIVVLTVYQGDEDIYRALNTGAATYLLKDTLSDELVRVIREVHKGNRPIELSVKARLAQRTEHPSLTPREVQVMELISQGMRNKEIAFSLGISEVTAQVHVKNIFSKLRVNDRTAAVRVALQRGIIHIR